MTGDQARQLPGLVGVTRGCAVTGKGPGPLHEPIPVAGGDGSGADAAVVVASGCVQRTAHAPGARRKGPLRDDRCTKVKGDPLKLACPAAAPMTDTVAVRQDSQTAVVGHDQRGGAILPGCDTP